MSYGYSNTMAQRIKERHEEDPDDPFFAMLDLCVARNVMLSEVAEKLGVSKQAVYDWIQQKYAVNPDVLDNIKALTKELKSKKQTVKA